MRAARAILGLVSLAAATTPALADADAGRIAAVLTHHLNAHGRHFVASEAKRLAIGDASESGAKDDVREACPQPASCFDTSRMSQDELMAAMLLLSAQRAESQLEQQIGRMTGRNAELKRLVAELEQTRDKDRIADLKSQIDGLNGDSQLDMIRLQDLMNKRNQAFDMMSGILQKQHDALNGIVGNMR